jgi:hypothetical protein
MSGDGGAELEVTSWAGLGDDHEIVGFDHGYDGVAAGDGVVREHHERAAVGRHLDRPGHECLARPRHLGELERWAVETDADTTGVGPHGPGRTEQA